MKYLIPDTNVFIQDFRMEGNSFTALMGNFTALADRMLIPKVVHQEHLNNFAKRLGGELKKLNDNYKNISRLVNEDIQEPEFRGLDVLINRYEEHVETKLNLIDSEILDYPPVSLEVVAKKAIKRLKPFKKSGEGYCDAIIWETILHVLKSDKECEIIFITNNKKDFLNGESIHDDLISDLAESDISPSRIQIYRTLKDVVDNLLLVHLETLDNLKEQINTDSIPGVNIEEWLSNKLFDLITEDAAGHVMGNVSTEECDIHLSEIYNVSAIRADDARVLSANNKYITLTAQIGLSIDVCANYPQYENDEYIETLFDNMHTVPAPYDCVTDSGDVEIRISIVFKDDDLVNGKIELISLAGKAAAIIFDVPGKYSA